MAIDVNKVTEHEKRFDGLWKRMDADLRLYYLDAFTLVDSKGKPIPEADSVTLNDPRTFADAVIGILSTANKRFNITGIDPTLQGHLEKEYGRIFSIVDDGLALQNIEPLGICCDFFSVMRGWIALRCLLYQDGKKYLPEIYPLDPRWVSWDVDRKGVVWASYLMRMTGAQLEDAYKYKAPKDIDNDVRHVWTRDEYAVYLGDKVIQEPVSHGLPHCPIIIVPVPTQPMLISSSDVSSLQYQGESIYAANRDTYKKLNDMASVWATLNKMQFRAPVVFSSPHGRTMEEYPLGIAVVVNVDEGEKFLEIPIKELASSAQILFGHLKGAEQRGSLSDIDYGDIRFELSALAIAKITERRNQLFGPRLKAKSTAYKRICTMVKQQIIKGGYKSEIDDLESAIELDKKLFDNDFQISIDFSTISPEQNIANVTIGQALRAMGVSKSTVFRDILNLEDPEEEIRLSDLENAHQEIPLLRLYDYAIELGLGDLTEEEIKKARATIIMNELDKLMEQAAVSPEAAPQPTSQPKIGLKMAGLPSTPGGEAIRIQREQMRRKGISQREEGKEAQGAGVEE